jgi:nicotinamide-nucleotide amidase
MPILHSIIPQAKSLGCRIYRISGIGESLIEDAIGEKILAIPGVELGYCARPGDVDVRIIGEAEALGRAHSIIVAALGSSIYSTSGEGLEQVLVKLLAARKETLAIAESCTGGLLAHRITNVPGASDVFIAGYVTYANATKIDILGADQKLIEQHGAVSGPVARAMAEGARARARSTYALATTGIAGPTGGLPDKPVGTVHIAFASAGSETIAKTFFFPSDRETFKQLAAQAAFDLLRRKMIDNQNPKSQTPNPSETPSSNTQ